MVIINYNQKSYVPFTFKDILNAFDIVWNQDRVQKIKIEGNPNKNDVYRDIRKRLKNNSHNIIQNVEYLRSYIIREQWLKGHNFLSIDDLIDGLGGDNTLHRCYSNYYEKQPQYLYKYVSCENACDDVVKSYFRCSSAKDYNMVDPRDSIALLDYDDAISEDDFYDLVLQEAVSELLDGGGASLEEKRANVNDLIAKQFYIGCLCEKSDSKYMWDNYGAAGICMEIDVSDLNVHKITYSDNPLDPKYIRHRFRKISTKFERSSYKTIRKQFDAMAKMVGGMGLLNMYRKDWKYHMENEWRLLARPNELVMNKKMKFKKIKINRVISDLPQEKDDALRTFCDDNNIGYERRICP